MFLPKPRGFAIIFFSLYSAFLLFGDEAYDAYVKAHEYRQNGAYQKALHFYQKAVQLDPENGKYNLYLGRLLLDDLQKPEQALPYLEKAVTCLTGNPQGYYYLARAYGRLKMPDESYAAYKSALALLMDTNTPPEGWLLHMLAYQALWEQEPKRISDAEYYFSLAQTYQVEKSIRARMALYLAYYYDEAHRYEKTLEVLGDFSLIQYRPAYGAYLVAHALGEQRRYQAALDILRQALPLEQARETPEIAWMRKALVLNLEYALVLGDSSYLAREYTRAHEFYKEAYSMYMQLPQDPKTQKTWEQEHDTKINREYTTNLLYFNEKGRDRKRYVGDTFLDKNCF